MAEQKARFVSRKSKKPHTKSAGLPDFLNVVKSVARDGAYSHSMVAGGLPDTSYTTRLMPRTSLMMRLDTVPSKSYGKCAQ